MNLYHGGCGHYEAFVVAEDTQDAMTKIGLKINAPHLPIETRLIDDIDGYRIIPSAYGEQVEPFTDPEGKGKTPVEPKNLGEPPLQNTLRHCKKCDFTTESQGELLAHYRNEHPKGG